MAEDADPRAFAAQLQAGAGSKLGSQLAPRLTQEHQAGVHVESQARVVAPPHSYAGKEAQYLHRHGVCWWRAVGRAGVGRGDMLGPQQALQPASGFLTADSTRVLVTLTSVCRLNLQ